ncbi:MAG: hypothetical protein VCB07_12215 [Gammaproteobacteria bacterium]
MVSSVVLIIVGSLIAELIQGALVQALGRVRFDTALVDATMTPTAPLPSASS